MDNLSNKPEDENKVLPNDLENELELEPEPQPQKPVIIFNQSMDKMEMQIELKRSGLETLKPDYEDIMNEIAAKSVTHGIISGRIKQLCERSMFDVPVVIAKGVPAKPGVDGKLTYLIETVRDLKPKLLPDGTVDYRDLGFTQNVTKGQPLCEIHPAQDGEDGFDIFGTVLRARSGKEPRVPKGRNTGLNEDGTMLLASCDGSVELRNGVINVLDILNIAGNVDNATGDINFAGDVTVTGDVVSGFKITSGGSVIIKGSVEGANIYAAGDVIVNQGINGMESGSITAGGNIKCKYIQRCFIKSGQDIYSDSVIHCTVECSGNMDFTAKKGRLIGGRASIAGYLKVFTIGTDSHVPTYVTMCASVDGDKKEVEHLTEQLRQFDAEEIKIMQIFERYKDLREKGRLTPEMEASIPLVKQNYQGLAENREKTKVLLEQAKEEMINKSNERSQNSYIECKGPIHTGVNLSFGPIAMQVQASFVNSRVAIVDRDIRVMSL